MTGSQSARHRARSSRPSIGRRPVDQADDESGEVVLALGIEPRHLRGLASKQGAAVLPGMPLGEALTICSATFGTQLAGCQIVQKKKRSSALYKDVVHAVIDQVLPNRCRAART